MSTKIFLANKSCVAFDTRSLLDVDAYYDKNWVLKLCVTLATEKVAMQRLKVFWYMQNFDFAKLLVVLIFNGAAALYAKPLQQLLLIIISKCVSVTVTLCNFDLFYHQSKIAFLSV